MRIYKRKNLRKEGRKHSFDQEKKEDSKKKERKHAFDKHPHDLKKEETKISTTLSIKKKSNFLDLPFFLLWISTSKINSLFGYFSFQQCNIVEKQAQRWEFIKENVRFYNLLFFLVKILVTFFFLSKSIFLSFFPWSRLFFFLFLLVKTLFSFFLGQWICFLAFSLNLTFFLGWKCVFYFFL